MGVAQHSLHRINSCTETSSTSLIMPKGSGLTKPMKLSADLADIVGKKEASRAEGIKELWAYLKKNNLQDPANKQFFTPDKRWQRFSVPIASVPSAWPSFSPLTCHKKSPPGILNIWNRQTKILRLGGPERTKKK